MSHKDDKKSKDKKSKDKKAKAKSKKSKSKRAKDKLRVKRPQLVLVDQKAPESAGVYDADMDEASVKIVLKRLRQDRVLTDRILVELEYSESDPRGPHRALLGAIERKDYLEWSVDLPEFPEALLVSSPHEGLEVLIAHKQGKLVGSLVGTVAGLGIEVIP